MGSPKSGNRTHKPRAKGAGRKPSPLKISDKVLGHLGRLITWAEQNEIDPALLTAAQNNIDLWLVRNVDNRNDVREWANPKHKTAP